MEATNDMKTTRPNKMDMFQGWKSTKICLRDKYKAMHTSLFKGTISLIECYRT